MTARTDTAPTTDRAVGRRRAAASPPADACSALNEVRLRGRLAAAPESRDLPSGDVLSLFRLIVDRPPAARGQVDTIDCSAATPRARRALASASAGEVLEVEGRLRRRFWRGPAGPASRYEVDVLTVARVARRRRAAAAGPVTGRRNAS